MFHEKARKKINVEIKQIDKLLNTYKELFEKCEKEKPDTIEIAALGSVLHSFYNGLENIFKIIAREVDDDLLDGSHWHRDLLVHMSISTAERKSVISRSVKEDLADYLGFRHFYRHSYSYFLDWDELKPLVYSLQEVWKTTKNDLLKFVETLATPSSDDQHGR